MVGDITSPDHPCVLLWGHSKSFSARIMCWRNARSEANDGRGSTVGGSRRQPATSSKVMIVSILILGRTLATRWREDDQAIELLVALTIAINEDRQKFVLLN